MAAAIVAIRNKRRGGSSTLPGPSPEVSASRAEAAQRQREFFAQLERFGPANCTLRAQPDCGANVNALVLKALLTLAAASRENKIKNIMKKYDQDGTGKLNVKELANLLQDLAGGTPPTEEEVRISCGPSCN
jgi:hypothetical protein